MPENPYLTALRHVPAGRTATFAELARLAERPRAARAAGRAIAALAPEDPRPWHRIVRGDGSLAPDRRRAEIQLARLRAESARPADGETVADWARRRRARRVGLWSDRSLLAPDDPRVARADPNRVEALRDDRAGRERGFAPNDPSPPAVVRRAVLDEGGTGRAVGRPPRRARCEIEPASPAGRGSRPRSSRRPPGPDEGDRAGRAGSKDSRAAHPAGAGRTGRGALAGRAAQGPRASTAPEGVQRVRRGKTR